MHLGSASLHVPSTSIVWAQVMRLMSLRGRLVKKRGGCDRARPNLGDEAGASYTSVMWSHVLSPSLLLTTMTKVECIIEHDTHTLFTGMHNHHRQYLEHTTSVALPFCNPASTFLPAILNFGISCAVASCTVVESVGVGSSEAVGSVTAEFSVLVRSVTVVLSTVVEPSPVVSTALSVAISNLVYCI